ncbi:MAG: hypothetical protein NC408_00875 [Candidatus Gastranaerophilales bacterium]|nr:hypothetical protein [Candidatus Gastranaerophilales bacterium]MCM1073654.1 hypothetical protein [Bacteroides sp.]
MAERLTTEQKQLITAYRQQYAELRTYSDEQILSIINNAASDITLSEDERVSILSNNLQGLNFGGLSIESPSIELTQEEESQLLSLLQARSESVTSKTEEAESKNGFLGKAWNWTKNNLLDWCTDSTNDIKKAQAEEQDALKNGNVKEAFEKITGLEYTSENISKFKNGELKTKSETAVEAYEEGQEMAADFAGDFVSGILSVGIYMGAVAAAPFTGGASIAVGLAAATVSAGLIKSGLKAWDAHSAKREYTTFTKDFITGGFSGLLAPITGGIGGAVGRNVAARCGVQALKHVGKESVEAVGKQTVKTMLTNPVGYEYAGGTFFKRWVLSFGSEAAVDGALGGSIDTTFRTAYEMNEKGEEITASALLSSFAQGGLGGLILAPAIGGGFKGMGKLSGKVFGKKADGAVPTSHEAPSTKPKPPLPEKISTLSDLFTVENISDSEADAILRNWGLSDTQIASLRNDVEDLNTMVNGWHFASKSLESDSDISTMSPFEIISTIKEVAFSDDADLIKYINQNNYDIIKSYFCKGDDNTFDVMYSLLQKSKSDELFIDRMNIANDIYRKSGFEFADIFDSLRYCNDNDIPLLTHERIEAQAKISKILGEDYFSTYDCLRIEDPSKITPELLSAFQTDVNRAKALNIEISYNDDVTVFASHLKRIVEQCEKAGLDFSWSEGVHVSRIDKILQGDVVLAKQFMDSCSDECKKKYANQITDLMAYGSLSENLKLYTDTYNLFAKFNSEKLPDAVRNPANFINALKENGVTDFEGVHKLLQAFEDVGEWPEGEVYSYIIKDGDYENAAAFVRELAKMPPAYDGGESVLHRIVGSRHVWDTKKFDFKTLVERMQNLNNTVSKDVLKEIDVYWFCVSPKPECVEIYKILNKYGLDGDYKLRHYIYDGENFTAKQLQEKLDIIVREVRGSLDGFEDVDDGMLLRILFSASNCDAWHSVREMIEKDLVSYDDAYGQFWRTTNSNGAAKEISSFFQKDTKELFLDLIKRRQELGITDKTCMDILEIIKPENAAFAKMLCEDKDFPKYYISLILKYVNEKNLEIAEKLYKNPEANNKEICDILCYAGESGVSVAEKVATRPDLTAVERRDILSGINSGNKSLAEKIFAQPDFDKNTIRNLLSNTHDYNCDFAIKLLFERKVSPKEAWDIIAVTTKINIALADKLLANGSFTESQISTVIHNASTEDAVKYAIKLCDNYKKMELEIDNIPFLVKNYGRVDYGMLKKLQRVAGKNVLSKLSDSELSIACQMVDIYGKNSINEIPVSGKKQLLRSLVACNDGLFEISPEMKQMFPLIPTDRETYCSLLPAIVRSMGIETNTLTPKKIEAFNHSVSELSTTLAKISDEDFANLSITQEFSREQFIRTTLDKVKHLSAGERQKVYDYFGFELYRNKTNETGFSIKGYPVNLNNGKKLAEINDPATKAVVESLRADVIRFSEQNAIKCSNPAIEKLLNDVVDVLPELRAQIGKTQHGAHDYSVLQHSLKVMQKVSQDPNFKSLNESDKKIMMLASLLHDITKVEGISDKTHASEGSFDAFFIAKKFNLTKDEEIKLFTLSRQHEWLGYVNTAKSEQELTRRLQSVAYDLRQDNLFDMALMFTHADLRAVKKSDYFHDTTVGDSRARFNGETRVFNKTGGTPVSHGEVADIYARRIREYVNELKKSQPLLPVTRMPKASTIAKAITHVNPDGTTNIKGVYKDSDGLIVIKYNEVEDWQALGFPNGASSRGTMAKGVNLKGEECDVETGNIKFFVHGLDYVNQLAKFDAFGLIDSDVLLSVSYAERPESKFRFFRTQGVLLDVDTKYVHGGGNTDSGSGCGKFLDKFKRQYLFGAERESDRLYISNMIKEATGMDDAEYIAFVKANENKSMHEIEPAEIRDKIIKAFATINSNVRRGNREYNEMYITNPDVMGVFAYAPEGEVGNAISFVNSTNRLNFLKEHAIERDLPFIVFGD